VHATGRSRRLADDGRHVTEPAVRSVGIVVGIVNAAPVVIFNVAQQPTGVSCTVRLFSSFAVPVTILGAVYDTAGRVA